MRRVGIRRCFLLALSHHAFGGQKESRDGGRVLQRAAHDLGRVDDAGLHQVFEFFGRRIETEGTLAVADLVDDDGAFPAGVGRDPACRILDRLLDDPDADLLFLAAPRRLSSAAEARISATPPPGTTPSSTAARVACSASSTRAFFSFISISVAAPTRMTATPPTNLASRSCSFSRS